MARLVFRHEFVTKSLTHKLGEIVSYRGMLDNIFKQACLISNFVSYLYDHYMTIQLWNSCLE